MVQANKKNKKQILSLIVRVLDELYYFEIVNTNYELSHAIAKLFFGKI